MKNKKWLLPVIIGVTLIVLNLGCKKDDDKTPTPTNTESREKFIGNYNVVDTGYNATPNIHWYKSYVMVITKNTSDTTKIYISNFNDSGNNLTASVNGSVFNVSDQPYGNGGTTIHGTGNISGNKLRFNLGTGGVGDYMAIYGTGIKF